MIQLRLLLKSISYRIFGSLTTAAIAFFITGSAAVGATVGVIDTLAKIWLYYLHEVAWQKAEKFYDKRKK